MAFTPDGIAQPGIPLLGRSPPTTMRYRTVFGREQPDYPSGSATDNNYSLSTNRPIANYNKARLNR